MDDQNLSPAMIGTPHSLIEVAIKSGSGIEHLEKLMDLQQRWEANEARKAFFKAKSDFQSKKPIIPKSAKVEFATQKGKTSYSFAPLPEIQKAVDPILAELGLSYHFEQEDRNGSISITCVLAHELGHIEKTYLAAPADTSGNKNSIQSIGSTVSYLKRYTLTNAIGISTEEDNDGEGTLTIKEAKELKLKNELVDLYFAKKDKLTEEQIERLEIIITSDESSMYQKSINHLKNF